MGSDYALARQRTKQTSFYLVRRADALLGALKFFSQNHADARRHLQFLAQIDFWEWELDNLIYSFTNLRERQKTWQSQDAIETKMAHLGIALQARRTRKVRWREGQWQAKQAGERVAPVALLREAIDAWNALVAHAESRFVEPGHAEAKRWGISSVRNLAQLRRTMPSDLVDDDTSDTE